MLLINITSILIAIKILLLTHLLILLHSEFTNSLTAIIIFIPYFIFILIFEYVFLTLGVLPLIIFKVSLSSDRINCHILHLCIWAFYRFIWLTLFNDVLLLFFVHLNLKLSDLKRLSISMLVINMWKLWAGYNC